MTRQQQQLVAEHFPRVCKIAQVIRRKLPRYIRAEDLAGYGCFGLIRAALEYDAARGATFRTWSFTCIRSAIRDGLKLERRQRRNQVTGTPPRACARSRQGFDHVDGHDAATAMLAKLTPRQGNAIWLRHVEGLELQEVGLSIGVDQSRAHQLCAAGIGRLQFIASEHRP